MRTALFAARHLPRAIVIDRGLALALVARGFCRAAALLAMHWFHFPKSQAARTIGVSVLGSRNSLASRCSAHPSPAASSVIDANTS